MCTCFPFLWRWVHRKHGLSTYLISFIILYRVVRYEGLYFLIWLFYEKSLFTQNAFLHFNPIHPCSLMALSSCFASWCKMPLDFLNACFFLIYKAKHKHTMISSSLIEAQMKTYYIGALYKFFPKYFSLFLLYATPDLTSFSRSALYKARNCEFSKEFEVKKSKKKKGK